MKCVYKVKPSIDNCNAGTEWVLVHPGNSTIIEGCTYATESSDCEPWQTCGYVHNGNIDPTTYVVFLTSHFHYRKDFKCKDRLCEEFIGSTNVQHTSTSYPSDGVETGQTAQLLCPYNHFLRTIYGESLHKTNTTVKCAYKVEHGKMIPKWVDSATFNEVECDDQCKSDKECEYKGDFICVDGR